jgi:hypothetical protein
MKKKNKTLMDGGIMVLAPLSGRRICCKGPDEFVWHASQRRGGGSYPGNTMGPLMQISPWGTSARASYFIAGMDSSLYSMAVEGMPTVE